MNSNRRWALCMAMALAGILVSLAQAQAGSPIVKGIVYDLDGKTALTSCQVAVTVKNSAGTVITTVNSNMTTGVYSVTIDTTKLGSDNLMSVTYMRTGGTG